MLIEGEHKHQLHSEDMPMLVVQVPVRTDPIYTRTPKEPEEILSRNEHRLLPSREDMPQAEVQAPIHTDLDCTSKTKVEEQNQFQMSRPEPIIV
jgi:hypothetical protein